MDRKMDEIALAMVAKGKGILAADESTSTAGKRLEKIGMENTEDNRRAMREMLFTAPGLSETVSGVILYDETLRQDMADGTPMREYLWKHGMIPGIKVDLGVEDFGDGEKVTTGLDGLPARLAEYFQLGARFAKWRGVYSIGEGTPSDELIDENARRLAQYARACQEAGLVPIVEPEVLMDGRHDIDTSFDVTERVLEAVFDACEEEGVVYEAMVLKPNMVLSGYDCPHQADVEEVARMTLEVLMNNVPKAVPGIAFLSGGQSDELATAHLNAMNRMAGTTAPWALTYSYGRALQEAARQAWADGGVEAGQKELLKRAKCNSAATKAEYSNDMESAA